MQLNNIPGIESPLTHEQWQFLYKLVQGEMGHALNRGYRDAYAKLTALSNKCAHQAEIALTIGLIGTEVK